jgi:hypothetical protein
MKKAILEAIVISALLCSIIVGMQNIQETKANFAPIPTTPPTVSIVNPANFSTQPPNVTIVFNVTFHDITFMGSAIPFRIEFYYRLDNQPSITIQPITIASNTTQNSESRQCKFTLQNLTDGPHNIQVSAKIGKTESTDNDVTWNFVGIEGYSNVINFTVDDILTPKVSILSPQNNSVFNVSIQGLSFHLIYETNTELSWVGYSIGGNSSSNESKERGNVTISGNGTLVRDFGKSGYFTLTLYANDTSGNWATPQTVTYLVNYGAEPTPTPQTTATPTTLPTPSITPSSSPTQTPTLSPSPTTYDFKAEDYTISIILYSSIALIVVIGLLVYFKKRKG